MYILSRAIGLTTAATGRAIRALLLAGAASLALNAPAKAVPGTVTIVPTFDSSITGAPNAVQIEAAINSAISTIDGLFTTLVTVTDNVYFQLGPGSFLAQTDNGFFSETYRSYKTALMTDLASNPSNKVLSGAITN